MDTYLILKTVHILGVIMLVGNVIVTGWWKFMANKTGDPTIISFAQRQVTLTDFIFTAGGSVLLFSAGISNTFIYEMNIITTPWLIWGLGLFSLSGFIWLAILIPIQIKQAREAKHFTSETVISDLYWKRERDWFIYGIPASILLVLGVIFMVMKPS